MAGGQSLNLQRAPGFSADPNDVVIIDEPGHPLYQKDRNDLPITREQVVAIALGPPASSIRVRRLEDGRTGVVTGRQRTKSAAVANAIGCGVPYTGGLQSVKDAIADFKKDADLVEQVTRLMRGTPRRLKCDPANDSIANVRGMMATENLMAQAESRRAQIQALQDDVNTFDVPIEIAAARRGLKVATAKRLLKVDLSAPPAPPKRRGKATRPSAKRIEAIIEAARKAVPEDAFALIALKFTVGWIGEDDFFKEFPAFRPATKPRAEAA